MPPASTPASTEDKRAELRKAALKYHEFPTPGKVSVTPTKQLVNQRDLALAYSPGVAAPCEEIVKDPNAAFKYTARGNLVAVISNGTAVLGLGDIGPLAAKPVMEGKGVLFKKFAGVDVFAIEIDENDPAKLVEVIAALEPTFTSRFRQASAAAPAPEATSLAVAMSLPTTFSPFSMAAATVMAVPCWSSWNTGIFRRRRSSRST